MLKMMFTCFLTVTVSVTMFAQQQPGVSSDELKRKQAEIQHEIDDLRSTLKDTKKNTKAGLLQLTMVQKKLRLREQAIGNINQQINYIEGTIGKSKNEIERLKGELDTLKQQYAKSIVYAYKNRSNYDFLNFIFSASSFNDALRRVQYLRAYRLYREEQASTIKNTQVLLHDKITGLETSRKEKDVVLQKQEKQKEELEDEKKEKNDILSKLKAREKEISKELTSKQKADLKLKSAINSAIAREIKIARDKAIAEARAREEAEAAENSKKLAAADAARKAREKEEAAAKKAAEPKTTPAASAPVAKAEPKVEPKKEPVKKTESVLEATPEGSRISGSFESNRGRLPWPVEKGNVKIHFGTYSIEGTKLRGNNPGITLATEPGAVVKAVFEGEVSRIFDIDGNWSVLIRHGKYFTVYSNLSSVSVSKDQKVTSGQMLGRAAANDDGNGEIEFLLMQENRNLDPESWIRRR
ncbi:MULTISPECIES: murein hydrolase activator EnvC family protein [Niastella]|uniref:Peptidoglycan DD-metalloendopeptidase family protein n=1 Tax=Niastella soli TaxID=2821487 RepID=A0ABS3YRJ0_9BACT|nr:peptidoglycan DD-metalloendopeptidase family protein [Niastella soli]MBO9200398.1 peptidoglycan DD-metalloendopeptidase family protein [Niastella soli]